MPKKKTTSIDLPLVSSKPTPVKKLRPADPKSKVLSSRSKSKAAVDREPVKEKKSKESLSVVGIGASAGGLEALELFFTHMPAEAGIAFIIIQHLDPTYKSIMDDILKRYTPMRVLKAEDGMSLEPNTVYLNQPDKEVAIFNGKLQLIDPVETHRVRLPIDYFFRSLAEDQGEKAICIILSGSGSDGTLGMKEIKGAGGMAMVQEPGQAKYDSMPRSAIDTGLVDYILPAQKIPKELIGYLKQPYLGGYKMVISHEKILTSIQKILMLIRSKTGHDFTHYKQNTIHRRVERRMALHKIDDIRNYVRYLQENPAEVKDLFKDLIIEVTNFFRDPEAFEVLEKKIIPAILDGKKANSAVRIWVPGCATGEEAFSLAMLFQEAMDRLNKHMNVQIFATDINSDAIEKARTAKFPASISADISSERLGRYFIEEGEGYRVKQNIRDMVTFAVQNLISDPPFSRIDLVSCRNLLIYLDTVLQKKIIPLFHYTLNQDGYLLLGSSETIGEFSGLFSLVDKKWKIFQRKGVAAGKVPDYLAVPLDEAHPAYLKTREQPLLKEINVRDMAEKIILDEYGPPCVFIDEKLDVLYFQGATDRYLAQPPGEPSFNLIKMAREELRYQLSAAVTKAMKQKKAVVRERLQIKQKDGYRTLDVVIRPVLQSTSKQKLVMVIFEEKVPAAEQHIIKSRKTAKIARVDIRVSSIEKELQSTKEYLRATIEQLQTLNEELRSANEEMQSTNEELQSANEELETSKEELQSTNEELVTVNSERQDKIEELLQANSDINNLLASTDIGTIFLDNALKIKRFTPTMTNIFNLIPADMGRPVSDITSRIPFISISEDARKVLKTLQMKETEVQTENGNWYSMHILPYRTVENIIDGVVVTFVDISGRKKAEQLGESARIYAEGIVDTVREPLIILDENLKVVSANRSFYQTFRTSPEQTEHMLIYDLGDGVWNIPRLRELLEEIIPNNTSFDGIEIIHDFPVIGRKTMLLNARMIQQADLRKLILLAIEDNTGREQTELSG